MAVCEIRVPGCLRHRLSAFLKSVFVFLTLRPGYSQLFEDRWDKCSISPYTIFLAETTSCGTRGTDQASQSSFSAYPAARDRASVQKFPQMTAGRSSRSSK